VLGLSGGGSVLVSAEKATLSQPFANRHTWLSPLLLSLLLVL